MSIGIGSPCVLEVCGYPEEVRFGLSGGLDVCLDMWNPLMPESRARLGLTEIIEKTK